MKGPVAGIVFQVCILALATLLPIAALADGMVIPQRAYAIPKISDQRALIHYADGTETLVIETSFVGQGTNFAWVVPLPTAAKIAPVSTGLFPTLQTIFQPKIVLSVQHYWVALPVAALVIWLFSVARRGHFGVLLVVCLLLLTALLLLPALTTAKSRASATGSTVANVRVLNRQNAGLYETVTIQSADPAALVQWLNENGFSAPTNIVPVVADYIRDGWVFAAARLHSEAGEKTPQATHPLAFTFKTTKPVYPLRLTGKGTTSCRVDLYVFGPGRAAAPGFTVERCESPKYGTGDRWPRLEAGELRIRHQELAKLVADAPVATKLSAALDASGMARDAYLDWRSYRPSGGKLYTAGAALTVSGNTSALLFMVLFMVWWLLPRTKGIKGFQAQKWGPWLAPVAGRRSTLPGEASNLSAAPVKKFAKG